MSGGPKPPAEMVRHAGATLTSDESGTVSIPAQGVRAGVAQRSPLRECTKEGQTMPARPRNPRLIAINRLRIDGGTQARANLDDAAIADYAAAMGDGAQFPPVEVIDDGQTLWLVDGFHRYHATTRSGQENILANITSGTLIDAVLRAAGANTSHGVRRTNADKHRAVAMVLALPGYQDKSDREIARLCGVTHPFVAACRRRADEVDEPQADEPEIETDDQPEEATPNQREEMQAAREGINAVMRLVKEARRQIATLCADRAGAFINRDAVDSDLSNALAALRGAMPARTCPVCHGEGCRTCRDTGWVSRLVDDHAIPAELREGGDA